MTDYFLIVLGWIGILILISVAIIPVCGVYYEYQKEISLDDYQHVNSYYVKFKRYPYLERDMADGKISEWELANIRKWGRLVEAEEEKQELNEYKRSLLTAEKGN